MSCWGGFLVMGLSCATTAVKSPSAQLALHPAGRVLLSGDFGSYTLPGWHGLTRISAWRVGGRTIKGGNLIVARVFELSFLELDLIGDALELDVRPFPFVGQIPVHGELIADRRRLLGVAAGTLAAKGLIAGDEFAPEMVESIRLFARGGLSIALLGSAGNQSHCARAAADGSIGVVAEQRGELIRFTPVTPDSLVPCVLSLLAPMPAGPGGSVTIAAPQPLPAGQTRQATGRDDDLSAVSYLRESRPVRESGAAQLAIAEEIARRPRLGSGYITITLRGRGGREGEPATLTWIDTDVGRYGIIPSKGRDGVTHVTYFPADLRRLAQNVSRLVATLNG
jgi:hypothetical protein